jgi:hypothetical protein
MWWKVGYAYETLPVAPGVVTVSDTFALTSSGVSRTNGMLELIKI